MDDSDEEEEDEPDVPGKKSKTNTKNNQKSLNSSTSSKYNNIMLIKNEQIVSNSSSINSLNSLTLNKSNSKTVTHLNNSNHNNIVTSVDGAERQQQNPTTQGDVSDRMSKEKQKFFRFSVFNSDRKHVKSNNENDSHATSNGSIKTDAAVAGAFDKYKFVSSSDSENENEKKICDKKSKLMAKGRVVALTKKTNTISSSQPPPNPNPNPNSTSTAENNNSTINKKKKQQRTKSKSSKLSSDSSCCTSGSGSSSGDSSSSSDENGSTTSSSTSSSTPMKMTPKTTTSLVLATATQNKVETETINTMNVFAAINSRELMMSQQGKKGEKRSPYCWTSSVPFNKKSQQQQQKSFGENNSKVGSRRNEVWGFAAEAQKTLNIFNTNSDNESRTATTQCLSNFSGTESDCHMSLLSMSSSTKNKRTLPSNSLLNPRPNQRTTTLMRNNTIMSSDDDAKQQLTPSKLVRKAVNYKKFDNTSAMNSKKLIMDASLNGAKYGSDDRPVKEPTSTSSNHATNKMSQSSSSSTHSQPPYDNKSTNNHNNDSMSMSGKEHFTHSISLSLSSLTQNYDDFSPHAKHVLIR